jgi:hypothetical protein
MVRVQVHAEFERSGNDGVCGIPDVFAHLEVS